MSCPLDVQNEMPPSVSTAQRKYDKNECYSGNSAAFRVHGRSGVVLLAQSTVAKDMLLSDNVAEELPLRDRGVGETDPPKPRRVNFSASFGPREAITGVTRPLQ